MLLAAGHKLPAGLPQGQERHCAPVLGVLGQAAVASILATLAGCLLLWLLKSETFFEILNAMRRRFWTVDLVTSEEPVK